MAAQTELQSRWGIEWTSWPTRQCRRKQCSRSNSALVPGKHDIVQQCKGFTNKKPTPSLWKVFLIPSKPYQKLAVGGIRKVLTWRLRDWKRGTWGAKMSLLNFTLEKATCYREPAQFTIASDPKWPWYLLNFFLQRPTPRLDVAVLVYTIIPFLSFLVHWRCCEIWHCSYTPEEEEPTWDCLGMFQVSETDFWRTTPPYTEQKISITTRKLSVETQNSDSVLLYHFRTIMFGFHIQLSILAIPTG